MVYLDSEDIARLMPSVFSKWQGENEVRLNEVEWFTLQWLKSVWKYFRNRFKKDLHRFENLHLLPIENGLVGKLSKKLPMISITDVLQTGQELPREIVNFLQ